MSRLHREIHALPRAGGALRVARRLRAVVIGGGIAGVAAATVFSERGVEVELLEREPGLGGRAGGFPETLSTGERVGMERGFHAFFRHYYNLRALLRRIDPDLHLLRRLDDYPILGPNGMTQSFAGLPSGTPWQVLALAWRTPYLRAVDLPQVDRGAALEMLRFDAERTYARFDRMTASAYLDSLQFPTAARQMLFDVFSHSFFNPESEMSAAELLMMFHFYMMGNHEGLIFDVARSPVSSAIWDPFFRWLTGKGARVQTGVLAARVSRAPAGGWRVQHTDGCADADLVVIALDVPGLQAIVRASPDLDALRFGAEDLSVTRPFAVWRLWFDRPMAPYRAPFAGTTGVGLLDNISIYDRFQDESADWARAHGGSVVELHAYAVAPRATEPSLKADLLAGLHALYAESRPARALDERFLLRQDCPAFPPGAHAHRLRVDTPFENLALAGDFVAMPVPCALMERAAASGFLAANTLLAPLGVRPEPIHSVPCQGLFSPPRSRGGSRARTSPSPVIV